MWIFNCSSPYIFNGGQVYSFRKKTYTQWSCKVIVQRRDQTNYLTHASLRLKQISLILYKESNIHSKQMKNQVSCQVQDNLRFPFQSLQPLLAISNPNLLNRACICIRTCGLQVQGRGGQSFHHKMPMD